MGVGRGDCGCNEDQVDLMFKRSEQYIDQEIADRTPQLRRYWVDLFPVKPFPDGVGLSLQKTRFYGDIGPQYDGFDGWRRLQPSRNAVEAATCGEHDACGHIWEDVGHGMETLEYYLMTRDIRTKKICIKDIRTFFQYETLQNLIFKNLTNITANMREQLNRNAAMSFALKHIALPNLPTASDPHNFPVIPGGLVVGKANYRLFLSLYHDFIQEAVGYELSTVDSMPAIGLIASPETFHDMILGDPELRIDLRHCTGTSCDIIKKYNILDGMGPFIFMPDLHAPRYNRDSNGVLYRVFPYDRNMPIELGTRPITNPEYHSAEFEFVQFMTRDLFTLRSRRPLTTVGGETNFDAEISPFAWKWHNPPREDQPWRRKGRYVATAEVGIEPGEFTDTRGVLIARKPGHFAIEYWGPEVCPPDEVECDNVLPAQACPCPRVLAVYPAVAPLEAVYVFDSPPGGDVDDELQLEEITGSFVAGNIEEVSADGLSVRLSFVSAPCMDPGRFVGVYCQDIAYCDAQVLKVDTCQMLANHFVLHLERPIKAATVAEVVTLIGGDGTTLDVPIFGVNANKMEWTVTLTFAQYCGMQGICSVCVPTATVGTCPGCTSAQFEACEGFIYP